MRAKSTSSVLLDAYEAGREIGTHLRELEPELVILFSSIHYDFAEQYEGLLDGLERREVLIFGGTGDGFFEAESSAAIGVAALGLNSAGAVRFRCTMEAGLGADSRAAAARGARALVAAAGEDPIELAMVLFDSLASTDNRVVEGINEVLDCAVFGGAVSDDRKLERSYVLHNGKAYADAVGVLGLSGDFQFAIDVENGTTPVSEPGIVDEVDGNSILRISGRPALEFIAERLGKAVDSFTDFDIGLITIQCSPNMDMSDSQFRSSAKFRTELGALETFGPVTAGHYLRVAIATGDEMIHGVETVLDRLDPATLGFEPVAALGVSCAGRKWLLGDRFDEEVQTVRSRRGQLPLVGFPSFGELAPRRRPDGSYSANLFHNVSFVLALLGPARPQPPA